MREFHRPVGAVPFDAAQSWPETLVLAHQHCNNAGMLDWGDVKFFLSLCADRTFAGTARKLGVNQTTVGRRLAAMERHLGAKLFERTADGLLLTATGQEIWAAAQT